MILTDYRNFDLLITRAGERYRAFVVDASTKGVQPGLCQPRMNR